MARPPRGSNRQPPKKTGPRSNNEITVLEIRLVGADGEMVGVVSLEEGLRHAEEAGMDLVEVSPQAKPPVCKILNVSKYRYELQKKAAEARKKQKTADVKEVKLRPNIGDHDYEVKMRNARKFLTNGDKVKVTLRFRGREMAHQHIGLDLLKKMQEEMADVSKVELSPKKEGRQMIMVLGPEVTK